MSKPYREYTEQDIYNLKKENERLKNERTIDLRNQLEQLKAENEELKDMLREANKPCDICINPYSKYKKCLNEIEAYCKTIKEDHYWGMREVNFAQHILKKIKEVKGNE